MISEVHKFVLIEICIKPIYFVRFGDIAPQIKLIYRTKSYCMKILKRLYNNQGSPNTIHTLIRLYDYRYYIYDARALFAICIYTRFACRSRSRTQFQNILWSFYCFNNPTVVDNDKDKVTFNHNDTQIIGGNGSEIKQTPSKLSNLLKCNNSKFIVNLREKNLFCKLSLDSYISTD
ncbi:hypothetical protein AGLY_005696 [Aphis glycines]|uniref:Uncharacterized protein n=1 Tax=Aphis glycines TaxID=307491 RepID=A0A6G0TVW2_APHGL|nr:hypothetical protein AGLY_005696 [Aphis glycines]